LGASKEKAIINTIPYQADEMSAFYFYEIIMLRICQMKINVERKMQMTLLGVLLLLWIKYTG
jgi:hypothetical protein